MAKIEGMPELLSALRAQLASRADAAKAASTKSAETQSTSKSIRAPVSVEVLRTRIGRDLRRVDLKSAVGRRQARFAFIEAVIAWEMGDELFQDQQIEAIIRDIEESMSTDPETEQALDRMLSALRGPD